MSEDQIRDAQRGAGGIISLVGELAAFTFEEIWEPARLIADSISCPTYLVRQAARSSADMGIVLETFGKYDHDGTATFLASMVAVPIIGLLAAPYVCDAAGKVYDTAKHVAERVYRK